MTLLTSLQHGCRFGAKLEHLLLMLAEVNRSVPKFGTDVGNHADEKKVRKPLQEVFNLYFKSHLFIISFFSQESSCKPGFPIADKQHLLIRLATISDPTQADQFVTHIQETARRLEEARGRFVIMADQAAQDKAREENHSLQPTLEGRLNQPNVLCNDSSHSSDIEARFVSLRRLGSGSFGEVDEVREISTGSSYARKHIHFDGTASPEWIEQEVKNEVTIMQRLRHMHIATVLFHVKESTAYSILMLPVADCDLLHYLRECTRKGYSPSLIKKIYSWFGCLLDALAYAHKLDIKHRDIKPVNILIKNGVPYLSDFGLARDFTEENTSASDGERVGGTRMYLAPECRPNRSRGRKTDVFSLGCVYSEMFTIIQEKPLTEFEKWRQTENGSVAFRDNLPRVEKWLEECGNSKNLDKILLDQILSMIHHDPEERPTSQQSVSNLKREPTFFCIETS